MEELVPLQDFPGYWISSLGYVKKESSPTPLRQLYNQNGLIYVSLWREGSSVNRALSKLVAQSFLPVPEERSFDTPISLNGKRFDCRAENLMWRPYWFARRYHQQFDTHLTYRGGVLLIETGEEFADIWGPTIKYGLLAKEIIVAAVEHERVWPGGYTFKLV
jgi:hypothetical protein